MIEVEFLLDHPVFRRALADAPDTELEWVRNVAGDDGRKVLVWADECRTDFGDALATDPTIKHVQTIEGGDRPLYEVRLVDEGAARDLFPIMAKTGGIVESATVTEAGWHCRLLFPNREAMNRYFDRCSEYDVDFEVEHLEEYRPEGPTGLTEAQREALRTALELGYYDVPRAADLDDVGDRLGITSTAASERLRRGVKRMIERTVDTPRN
jgi:predicted DNA binding protein